MIARLSCVTIGLGITTLKQEGISQKTLLNSWVGLMCSLMWGIVMLGWICWGLLVGDILTEGLVYRAGENTLNNYTPSLPKDLNGLSMFSDIDTLKQRLPKADKAQVIDLSKLGDKLVAIDDGNGHISIKPANDINGIEMKKWGDLKGSDELPNPLAEQIKKSRVDTVKLYKK